VAAVWFDAGAQAPGRLLLTIHHLAVDGVSWRILVPELAAAWEAIAQGKVPALAARATSFRGWAQRLASHARAGGRVEELAFWSGMLGAPSLALVENALDPTRDINGTAGRLTLTLPAALTGALLTRVPAAFHGGINDVLLTGLVVAIADWCRRRGRGTGAGGLVDLEGTRGGGGVGGCSSGRDTGARRCSGISTCPARWAGSPACSRCGSIPARLMSRRRWRGAGGSGAGSRAPKGDRARW